MSLLGLHVFAKAEAADPRVMHTCAISRGRSESNIIGEFYSLMMASAVHILVFLTVTFLRGISVKKINSCTKRASQHWDGWQIRANGGCLD